MEFSPLEIALSLLSLSLVLLFSLYYKWVVGLFEKERIEAEDQKEDQKKREEQEDFICSVIYYFLSDQANHLANKQLFRDQFFAFCSRKESIEQNDGQRGIYFHLIEFLIQKTKQIHDESQKEDFLNNAVEALLLAEAYVRKILKESTGKESSSANSLHLMKSILIDKIYDEEIPPVKSLPSREKWYGLKKKVS